MIGDKVEQFQGKGKDPDVVRAHIEEYLRNDGFTVQTSPSSAQGEVIQAKKGGFLRGVVDADRAMTITITGTSDDLTVHIGIGKWLEHLGVAAIETLLVSDLFLVVDVAESAWNIEIGTSSLRISRHSSVEGAATRGCSRPISGFASRLRRRLSGTDPARLAVDPEHGKHEQP